jgi:hypothetical protein
MMSRMKRTIAAIGVAVLCVFQFGSADAGQEEVIPAAPIESTLTYYIHDADLQGGQLILQAERIAWYTGEEADEQLRLHEPDAGISETPDGYYIVPSNSGLETLKAAPDASVLMQIYNRSGNLLEADIVWNEAVTTERFAELLANEDAWNLKDYPYHMTFREGKIVRIVQQYIP